MDTGVINFSKNFMLLLEHCCFRDVDRIFYTSKSKTLFFKNSIYTLSPVL